MHLIMLFWITHSYGDSMQLVGRSKLPMCCGTDLMFSIAEQMQIHVNTDISTSPCQMLRQKVYNLKHQAFKIQLEVQINYVTEILSALINVKYSSFKGRERKAFFFKAQVVVYSRQKLWDVLAGLLSTLPSW